MDLRIEKTYRSLLTAFRTLLEERCYEDITVAMLCDAAMIRRTTFYKHFSDKAAFCSFFMDNLRADLLGNIADVPPRDQSYAILYGLVDFMSEHERLINNVFGSSMSGMMVLMMEDKVAETIRERYRHLFSDSPEDQVRLVMASEFAAGGVVRLLSRWWVHGHREHHEERAAMASELIVRALGAHE